MLDGVAEAVGHLKPGELKPWHIIVTILGVALIFNLPSLHRAQNEKFEIKQRYEIKRQRAKEKLKKLSAKREQRKNRVK